MRFERTRRETIYEGKILRAYRDEVLVHPGDGRKERVLHLEHVEHPGAACVVPFLDSDRILLIRQFRYSAGGEIWEIPAGKLDGGEPPEECIRRELVEETGYFPGCLEFLGTLIMTPGFCDERIAIFEATDLQTREASAGEDEFLTPFKTTLREAVAMIERGEIQDSKSVAGLLLAARRHGI
jgi:ADP-ribose pyrophosphatase